LCASTAWLPVPFAYCSPPELIATRGDNSEVECCALKRSVRSTTKVTAFAYSMRWKGSTGGGRLREEKCQRARCCVTATCQRAGCRWDRCRSAASACWGKTWVCLIQVPFVFMRNVLLAWRTDFACCCAVVHVLCAVCWADSARSVVAATIYCKCLGLW
jgi:hypothetical protein